MASRYAESLRESIPGPRDLNGEEGSAAWAVANSTGKGEPGSSLGQELRELVHTNFVDPFHEFLSALRYSPNPRITGIPSTISSLSQQEGYNPANQEPNVPDSWPPSDQTRRMNLIPPVPNKPPQGTSGEPVAQHPTVALEQNAQVENYQATVDSHMQWVLFNVSKELGREVRFFKDLTTQDIEKLHSIHPIPEFAVVKAADAAGIINISLERSPKSAITFGDVAGSYQWLQQPRQKDLLLMVIRKAINDGKEVVIRTPYPEKPEQRGQKPKAKLDTNVRNRKAKRVWSVKDGEEFPPRT